MDIFSVLTMLGGLALFLYGMDTMGAGLSQLSGGRMERLLEKLTSNRIKAVLLGAGVTAVIQSSSATTVMVVGFVNSGIMKLNQAIGIIMGANIGTTITSWILSLSGIQGDNILIKLLKPTSFSPVLAVVGVIFIMFSKSDKKKIIGGILVGFAILMFGMDTMSSSVAPLADNEKFTGILTMFSNPILGLLAGTILTAIIQSSSASVGILQALCMTGAVGYSTAIPIILGQNIGTCVTALMSSVGASKNARRAAMVHLYFNIVGTTVFMIVFYVLNAVFDFSFMAMPANAAGIAVVHTLFNVTATAILLPFGSLLEKMAMLTIPDKEEAGEEYLSDFSRLDDRFLDTPGLAVEECRLVAVNMAKKAKDSIFTAIGLLDHYDEKSVEKVIELENQVDKYEDVLGTYLVKLSSRNLTKAESRTLSIILHCIGDFERISDHAINIQESCEELHKKELSFSPKAKEEITIFSAAIKEILEKTITVFETGDLNLAREVEPLEQVIDNLNLEEKNRHINRLRNGKCTIELGFALSDISTNFERIADHCSNIAITMIQVSEDGYDTHEYLEVLKEEDGENFTQRYMQLSKKYELPGSSNASENQ